MPGRDLRACILGADEPADGGMGGGGGGGSGRPGAVAWRGVGETPGVMVGEEEGRDMVFASGCELAAAAAWRGCIWICCGKGNPLVPTVSSPRHESVIIGYPWIKIGNIKRQKGDGCADVRGIGFGFFGLGAPPVGVVLAARLTPFDRPTKQKRDVNMGKSCVNGKASEGNQAHPLCLSLSRASWRRSLACGSMAPFVSVTVRDRGMNAEN